MSDVLPGSLNDLKTKIGQSWSRLTENDLSHVEGNWERLSEKLQEAYGYTKEQAEEEIGRFRRKVFPS